MDFTVGEANLAGPGHGKKVDKDGNKWREKMKLKV